MLKQTIDEGQAFENHPDQHAPSIRYSSGNMDPIDGHADISEPQMAGECPDGPMEPGHPLRC